MNLLVLNLALFALIALAAFGLLSRTKGSAPAAYVQFFSRFRFALAAALSVLRPRREGEFALANIAEGTHAGSKRYLSDAAIATRYLLGKKGTDADHIAICGAGDEPIVSITDEATAAEKEVTGEFLSTAQRTLIMIASEAITADEDVYTAANGKIQDEPTVAGTYYKVGRARSAASADEQIEVIPCAPIKVVVIAALTSTNGTAAAAADLTALKAEAEKIGDDVRALGAALATPALVKVLV